MYTGSHFLISCVCIFSLPLAGQRAFHTELLSQVRPAEHSSSIWGYTDDQGVDYALLGTTMGLRVYSLENPRKPVEVGFIPGNPSAWREIKTSGHFAYVATEGGGGLLAIDLSAPRDSLPYRFIKTVTKLHGVEFALESAHTLFVDERGRIFLAGARPTGYGFVLLDPSKDPYEPVLLGESSETYIHEVYVFRDTLYAAELFNGVFSIWNLADPEKPFRLTDQPTGGHFAHSVWKEPNRQVLYTTDEVEGTAIEIWDLSQPDRIIRAAGFRLNAPFSIPHNVFYHQERLYVSHYTEGLRILDVRDPYNPVEVAWYDTHEEYTSGFHGCWSAYPFFASGLVIASDIENGLFVLRYDGNEAATLHLNVRSSYDSLPVPNARVTLRSERLSTETQTNASGLARTGFAETGNVQLEVSKKGYRHYLDTLSFNKDTTLQRTIFLDELPRHTLHVVAKDGRSGDPLGAVHAALFNSDFLYRSSTDDTGVAGFSGSHEGTWSLSLAKWGYAATILNGISLRSDTILELDLYPGYADDFLHDLSWTSASEDPAVSWIRADLGALGFSSSNFPTRDVPGDAGEYCYFTSNYDASDTAFSAKGHLVLRSPPMDLSKWDAVEIGYQAWSYGGYASTKYCVLRLNDSLHVLEAIPENLSGQFNPRSVFRVNLGSARRDSSHFEVWLYNHPDSFYHSIRLLAAFDAFSCKGVPLSIDQSPDVSGCRIWPNPVVDQLIVAPCGDEQQVLRVLDSQGRERVRRPNARGSNIILDLKDLEPGYYLLQALPLGPSQAFIKIGTRN
ncbi:MAG: hypothetical protein JPMHGGIA_02311 [Saprospiraceae bacterium]|nr:hypothetical protein [Saprospiraceae bacterium]